VHPLGLKPRSILGLFPRPLKDRSSTVVNTVGAEAKYEPYREAWRLLRKASESEEVGTPTVPAEAPRFPRNGLERMQEAANYFRRYLEKNGDSAGE
jgi:hypothetical protein